MLGQILIGILFGGCGAWLAYNGLSGLIKTRRFTATATRTAGTVVAYESAVIESKDSEDRNEKRTYYYPIVEFWDSKGIQRRVKASTCSSPKSFSEGAAVTVLYKGDDPGSAEIESFGESWSGHLALSVGGAVLMSIAIAVWVFNVPVSTQFGTAERRSSVPGQAAPLSTTAKPFVELRPIVITEVDPNQARIGEPMTLRGSNFGRQVEHRVSIGGHGMQIYLDVIKWEKDAVAVKIPNDPRILLDRAYYYRIERKDPYESSNLFMFEFERK